MRKLLVCLLLSALALTSAQAQPRRHAHRVPAPVLRQQPPIKWTRGLYMATTIPTPAAVPTGAKVRPTVAQVAQNPLLVLQQFTVADLQAALADAQSQTPADTIAANCYSALIPFVQSQQQSPLPTGVGAFQALQKARDAANYIANINSNNGPLSGLSVACSPLVLSVQNTVLMLGVTLGIVANPAGAAGAATAGAAIPAAVAAFLNLPKL